MTATGDDMTSTIYSIREYIDERGLQVIVLTPTTTPSGTAMGETGERFLGQRVFHPTTPDGKPAGPGQTLRFPIDGARCVSDAFEMFEAAAKAHCEKLSEAHANAAEKRRKKIILPGATPTPSNLRIVP